MNCTEVRELVESWETDGTVNRERREELIGHINSCPTCEHTYGPLVLLIERDAEVIDQIPAEAESTDGALVNTVMDRIHGDTQRTFPIGKYRPTLIASAAILVALVGVLSIRTLFLQPRVLVEFSLQAPSATSVHLVGDFNRWDPSSIKLSDPDNDGVWTARLRLKQGEIHSYNFVIDEDRWIPDPESLFNVDDGFGGVNSMIKL